MVRMLSAASSPSRSVAPGTGPSVAPRGRAEESSGGGPTHLVENSKNGVRGVVAGHACVSESADGADDGDHRIGRDELKSKAHPVVQSPALCFARAV